MHAHPMGAFKASSPGQVQPALDVKSLRFLRRHTAIPHPIVVCAHLRLLAQVVDDPLSALEHHAAHQAIGRVNVRPHVTLDAMAAGEVNMVVKASRQH